MSLCSEAHALIHLSPTTHYWCWTSSRRCLYGRTEREGLKILLDGLQTIFWPYLCTCTPCTNSNGAVDFSSSQTMFRSTWSFVMSSRRHVDIPGYSTVWKTLIPSPECSTTNVQPYQIRCGCTEALWPQNISQPVLLVILKRYWNTQMLEWVRVHQFGPCVFAGWCEGKTGQTTWHFWGKLVRG